MQFELKYFETDEKTLSLALMDLLLSRHALEKAFFDCFRNRLSLDPTLTAKREAFVQTPERARRRLVSQYRHETNHNGGTT